MDLDNVNGFSLKNLGKINVILGKNGCGKSYLLKQVEVGLKNKAGSGRVRYVTPERAGQLLYEPNIDLNIANNPDWMAGQRRRNQSDSFRQQSMALFRRLEIKALRSIEKDQFKAGYVKRTFDDTVALLNSLLDRVEIRRDDTRGFAIFVKETGTETQSAEISSGEAELISLGIEFLAFIEDCEGGKENVLLVDEPDVHLHPDLQQRLSAFIVRAIAKKDLKIILATHSTALLAGLAEDADVRVAFIRKGDVALQFKAITDVDKTILPIFGAHPLSNVFNKTPILLIEGEDDERVWQQGVRSANGKLRVYPCPVEGIARFAEYESEVRNVIESVYDDAKAYSLRDRDLQPELIDDVGPIIRMRLSCRAAENLMLSDDALTLAGSDWTAMQEKIRSWVADNGTHKYHADMKAFVDGGLDRKSYDLKDIRNILIGLISNKPWEILVGQAIASVAQLPDPIAENSVRDFLGEKVCEHLLRSPAAAGPV